MWIFLNDAFVSIVADRNDQERLLVRARFSGDIERLWPGAEVVVGAGSDYLYRAFLPRHEVVEAIAHRLLSIEYDNFKESVHEWHRHDAYYCVWDDMCRAQESQGGTRLIVGYRTPLDPEAT